MPFFEAASNLWRNSAFKDPTSGITTITLHEAIKKGVWVFWYFFYSQLINLIFFWMADRKHM